MHARFHRILLGWQSERIPAHGMQHVKAAHPFIAGHDVRGGVPFQMPDMQARPGGIWKHVEAVELGLGGSSMALNGRCCFPIGLPLRFKGLMIVGFAHSAAV